MNYELNKINDWLKIIECRVDNSHYTREDYKNLLVKIRKLESKVMDKERNSDYYFETL